MPVTVNEITMVTPDIICIEYRDEAKIPGEVYVHGTVETGAYDTFVTRTHPTRGSLPAQILGKNKEYWWFADTKPTSGNKLDRSAVDTLGNWGAIGGRSVTAVYRRSTPYGEGMAGAASDFFSTMSHRVYLKLSGNLAQGTHTIVHPASLSLSNSSFVFNDKTTRCRAIKTTQIGHRPGDAQKKAFLGEWIPGYGTQGEIEFATAYGISQFYIIDANGNAVAGPFSATLRTSPTTDESTHGSFWNVFGDDSLDSHIALKYYVSLTQATIAVQGITAANPAVVTATGHGLSDGDKITLRDVDINSAGTRGMAALSGVFARVQNATTDTFTMKTLSANADVSSVGQTLLQGGSNNGTKICRLHRANRAGTYVYALDYSAWTPTVFGAYRVYIPGLGVSDPFVVDEALWHYVADALAGGIYNQRNGMALSASVGGYERQVSFRHGVNSVLIHRSTMPGYWSVESGFGGPLATADAAKAPWITTDEIDWWGGHQDAGDWDSILSGHSFGYWLMLDVAERITAARSTNFGIPKSSSVIGSGYAGTDSLPDLVHEVIWGLDTWRRNQRVDGSVYGGLQFGSASGAAGAGGGGANLFNASWTWRHDAEVMAPDHVQNFIYAGVAAKMSKVLRIFGFTSLADTWLASAEAAYDWADLIYTDGTARDAYYLDTKTNAAWSDPTYATQIGRIQATVPTNKSFAAASLLSAVTGDAVKVTKYKTAYEMNPLTGADSAGFAGAAQWEYINDPNANATTKNTLRNIIMGNADGYFVVFHEATASYEWIMRAQPLFHAEAFAFSVLIWAHQTQTDATKKTKYLKALQAQMCHFLGANALGRSFVTGYGARYVTTQLHADGQLAGGVRPPGTPCYVYTLQGGGTVSSFNIGIAIPPNPHPANTTSVQNSDWPVDRLAVPLFEAWVETPWAIAADEFTIGGQTMPWLAAATFLHAWGGNTITRLSPDGRRRIPVSLTATA